MKGGMKSMSGKCSCGAVRFRADGVEDCRPAGYAFAGDHPRLTEQETLAKFTSTAG